MRFAVLGLFFLPMWGGMGIAQPQLPGSPAGGPPKSPANNDLPVPKALVNSTRVVLKCAAIRAGAEGIHKVDLWVTSDGCKSWRRLPDGHFHNEELEAILPGEGLFGLIPVVAGKNGQPGLPPRPGQAPAMWLEVDTTGPTVQLRQVKVEGSVLNLAWQAQDRNLGPTPVTLAYRTQPTNPWRVIARGLPAQGCHRWKYPCDQGSHFYLRVSCRDRAGNTRNFDSTKPVILETLEPKLVILGATAQAARTEDPATGSSQSNKGSPAFFGSLRKLLQETPCCSPTTETPSIKTVDGQIVQVSGEVPIIESPEISTQAPTPKKRWLPRILKGRRGSTTDTQP